MGGRIKKDRGEILGVDVQIQSEEMKECIQSC